MELKILAKSLTNIRGNKERDTKEGWTGIGKGVEIYEDVRLLRVRKGPTGRGVTGRSKCRLTEELQR